jgi:hypothetical protein
MPAHLRTIARTASSQCLRKPNQFGGRLTPNSVERWVVGLAYPRRQLLANAAIAASLVAS